MARRSWQDALAMSRLAVNEGIRTIIATPHQLGNFSHNTGDAIRSSAFRMQDVLDEQGIDLRVLPGADVRVEPGLISRLVWGEVLTLGDHRRHVLLELPHELYFPLQPLLQLLDTAGMAGILSHPERNQGLLANPHRVSELVDSRCLMQITAGSLTGTFGSSCQQFCEWMLRKGLVHFVATDAHGFRSRRPLLGRAFQRVVELTDEGTALDLFHFHPTLVSNGQEVAAGRRTVKSRGVGRWIPWRKAG